MRRRCDRFAVAVGIFAAGIAGGTNGVQAEFVNLGPASDYNVFVFGNDSQTGTVVEGRVAVGGDALFHQGYSGMTIASKMSTLSPIANLVVGGNYSNIYNTVNGPIVIGGNATIAGPTVNGNLSVNGNVTLSSWGTINNSTFTYGGTLTNPNTTFNNVTTVLGTTSLPIDFAATKSYLTTESGYLGGLAATGTTLFQWGGLTLTPDAAHVNDALQVFNVKGSDLSGANNMVINAHAGQTVVVNIDGAAGNWQGGLSLVGGVDNQHVLYNFTEASVLNISNIGIQGSVLAPLAAVNFTSGQFNGTLIANSLAGSGSFANYQFLGQIPSPPLRSPEPASIVLLGTGAIAWMGVTRRRSAAKKAAL